MNGETTRGEVLAFLRSFERKPRHVVHVARLALQLFDGAARLHGLSERDRKLLEAAALLHDVGSRVAPAGKDHHKESARLIRGHVWSGFTPAEVHLFATIARYHRGSPPSSKHTDFAMLAADDQSRVQTLAALLRLADGLEYSHQQLVRRVQVEILTERLVIHLYVRADAPDEFAAAHRKCDLARRVFHREIHFALHLMPMG